MDNPLRTVIICLSYVSFGKVLGPQLMEKRAAFELRGLMMVYNLFQILLHILLLWDFSQTGWLDGKFSFWCEPVDYSQDESALRVMRIGYMFYLSKYVDMFDTLFYILHKKSNQITFLHITHHGLVPFICYLLTRYVSGGNSVISGVLNSLEHILMYSYYLVAAMGPPEFFFKCKKYVTTFQISRFLLVLLHSLQQLFNDSCGYPMFFNYLLAGTELLFLYLFIQFYTSSSYKKKKNSKSVNKKEL